MAAAGASKQTEIGGDAEQLADRRDADENEHANAQNKHAGASEPPAPAKRADDVGRLKADKKQGGDEHAEKPTRAEEHTLDDEKRGDEKAKNSSGDGVGGTATADEPGAADADDDDDADDAAGAGAVASRRRLTDGASAGYGEHLFVCRFGAGAGAPKTEATRITDKVAKCRTPALPPGNVPVFLSLNGQDFSKAPGLAGELAFYPPPVLVPPAALSPIGGPTAGGTAVGISGSGLLPFELTSRSFSDVVCRFGEAFHADYHNLVTAVGVSDSTALCVTPTTRVANYSFAGVTGHFEFRLSANGGLDAASDDVDFTRGVPPPLQFFFYTVPPHAPPPYMYIWSGGV